DPRTIICGAGGEGDVAGAVPGGGAHHDVSRASDGGLLGVVDRHGEAARGGVGRRGRVGRGAGDDGGAFVGAGDAGRIADGRDPRTIISGADGEGDVAGADPGGGAQDRV